MRSIVIVRGGLIELNRLRGHNGGDGVLIDQLRLSIAAQQNAKVIKPTYNTLQFDSIHKEYRQRRSGFTNTI
jgi:hypothetical protein